MAEVLPRSFFAADAAEVAPRLLGHVLVWHRGGKRVRLRVVETEAYLGPFDLACHAAKGRTARTEVMFGPSGHAYVYLIYGIYHMLNVVTGAEGDAQAVLIRAAEPLCDLQAKTDGPGKLTRALGIDRSLNGRPLDREPLYFEAGAAPRRIAIGPRIGIDYAGAWRDKPLRFFDPDSPFVSRPR
jgi:DNA-3-methyladenine glycosylase